MNEKKHPSSKFAFWDVFFVSSKLGFTIALLLIAPLLIGLWIDNKFSTHPWAILGGVVVGFLCVGVYFKRILSIIEK